MKLSLTLITISYLSLLMIGCNENYSFEVAGNDINNSASDSLANTYVNDTNLNPLSLLQFLKSDSSCFTSAKLSKLTEKKRRLTEKEFNNLSQKELFIYAFSLPENYYQSCSIFPLHTDVLSTIPAYLPRVGQGFVTSNRQDSSLLANRDSTIFYLNNCLSTVQPINPDYFRKILILRAYECIPALIARIEKEEDIKNPFLLTTLCKMMLYNYEPFMNSPIQDSLYPLDSTGRASFEEYLRGNRNIPFTCKNKDLIIKMASSFYSTQIPKKSSSITIEKGQYRVGEAKNLTNPLRTVEVESYKISAFELTNYEFSKFIEATGYVTDAERKKDALVFRLGKKEFEWVEDSTANWRFPNGISKGGIDYKMNHPVTCISYRDALAYCKWANVRLPTIDEWEIASRSDGQKGKYFFGKETDSIFNYANIWRGKNHATKDPREDYFTTSPVGSYLPNPKGLFDIYGNIFEFCSDLPPVHEGFKDVASTRGGSWWCSKYACGFFNSIDIGRVKKEASFSNNGFRIVELNLN